jgi:hypothetical protein
MKSPTVFLWFQGHPYPFLVIKISYLLVWKRTAYYEEVQATQRQYRAYICQFHGYKEGVSSENSENYTSFCAKIVKGTHFSCICMHYKCIVQEEGVNKNTNVWFSAVPFMHFIVSVVREPQHII